MRRKYIGLLFLLVLAGCADNESGLTKVEEAENADSIPAYKSIAISEVLESDAQAVTFTQTYAYDDAGRLSGCTARQTTQGTGTISIERMTTVSYDGSRAVVTDEEGNVLTYTLTENNRAASCLYRSFSGDERHYTFSYAVDSLGRNYLEYVSETLGDASEPYSEIEIDYTCPEALVVTTRVDGTEQCFLLTFPSGEGVANRAALPCLPLTELYPLSLHTAALYGHLLGDAYEMLQTSCIPTDNADSEEVTRYAYDTNTDGFPTQCQVVTESYGEKYRRTLNYTFEW